jgi:hypothetical protein
VPGVRSALGGGQSPKQAVYRGLKREQLGINEMSVRELEFAKVERQRLRGELASLESKRSKLSEASVALSAAEKALGAFEAAESSAITAWSAASCKGERPVPNAAKHTALSDAVFLARRHVESSAPAIAVLDFTANDLRNKLDENRLALADAAAKQMAADHDALTDRAREIRDELARIEWRLGGGHAFFRAAAEGIFGSTGKRNPALDAAANSAKAGLIFDPVLGPEAADRAAVQAAGVAFEQLQAG